MDSDKHLHKKCSFKTLKSTMALIIYCHTKMRFMITRRETLNMLLPLTTTYYCKKKPQAVAMKIMIARRETSGCCGHGPQ